MTAVESVLRVPLGEWLLGLLLVLLAWRLGGVLRSRPRSRPDFLREERAHAMLDFTLVFPLFSMIILILAQLSLLIHARLVVGYAAFAACRSAVVWLDSGEAVAQARAERSAAVGCMPISPGGVTPGVGWFQALPAAPLYIHDLSLDLDVLRRILRGGSKLTYSKLATSVDIILPDGALGAHDPVTVEVEHAFYLSVPYGAVVFRDWEFGPVGLPFRTIRDRYTLTNEGHVQSR